MRYRVVVAVGLVLALGVGVVAMMLLEPSALADLGAAQVNPRDARKGTFVLDCSAPPKPISPLIYGIGGSDKPWTTGTTAVRQGGNPTTRYNWELDTWNTGSDWYFRNVGGTNPGRGHELFLAHAKEHGVKATLTLPMLGWVAKDATSYSFPVSIFGPQQAVAPELQDAGNGIARDGGAIVAGSPTRTSVRSTPEIIGRLVKKLGEFDRAQGRVLDAYILDNEPMLWNATHRDVHPEPATYDELLEKTVAYATAIRAADPTAKIAGPAEWGWLAYHYSAKDTASGVFFRPDRRLHGDEPLIPWYLKKLREHERRTGVKLLDILDVHYYPMGDGLKLGGAGDVDAATAARRIRATRSLWDPTYRDESWVNDRMQVLPLLRRWVDENYPGLGISIGEWDFGAERHMSGGLATAEVLGRFGVYGLTSAYRWGSPAEKTPAFWAFRAYRNFDGEGGRFQDLSIPVKGDASLASLFASRDEAGKRLVMVVLNLAPQSPLNADVSLQGCGDVAFTRGFTYAGGEMGFSNFPAGATQGRMVAKFAPYTINVIDVATVPSAP